MAATDRYVDTLLVNDKLTSSSSTGGERLVTFISIFQILDAEEISSTYRLVKNINPELIPISCVVANDVITAVSSADIGTYETGIGGAVIDVDCIAAAVDLATGHTTKENYEVLELTLDANTNRPLWKYPTATLAMEDKKLGYDLVLTATAAPGADGYVRIVSQFVQG